MGSCFSTSCPSSIGMCSRPCASLSRTGMLPSRGSGGRLNSRLSGRALRGAARLGKMEERRLVALSELEGLSARGTERLLRVARTIADLAEAESVDGACLEEAARYRSPASVAAQRLAG